MKYNRQNLVNAEVNIARATWMATKNSVLPPTPENEEYVVTNIQAAIKELQLSIGINDELTKKIKKS